MRNDVRLERGDAARAEIAAEGCPPKKAGGRYKCNHNSEPLRREIGAAGTVCRAPTNSWKCKSPGKLGRSKQRPYRVSAANAAALAGWMEWQLDGSRTIYCGLGNTFG